MRKKLAVLAMSLFLAASTPIAAHAAAMYEPSNGCYLGAYMFEDSRCDTDPAKFNELVGKKQASFFDYLGYGAPFPKKLAAEMKANHAALHLAWEPNSGLDEIHDDAYLHQFMKDARESGIPIFLRFASEMNGPWVAWNGNPELYKEKWRLIWKVAREEAPNVAMVWVPFEMPQSDMAAYYPGDEYVDWIGMNIYCVWCHDGDLSVPAYNEDPLAFLQYLYGLIPDKPIFIAELGITHYDRASGQNVSPFTVAKMKRFYQGIQESFHRVKAVYYFDVDAANKNHDRWNDYSLSNGVVLDTFKNLISSPYFLSDVQGWISYKDNCLPTKEIGGKTYVSARAYALANGEDISPAENGTVLIGGKSYPAVYGESRAWIPETYVGN